MDADERGDLAAVEVLARELGARYPEIRGWAAYVIAACQALAGDAVAGLGTLQEAAAAGEWWAESLLSDPALAAIWPLDRVGLREESVCRAEAARRVASVQWEIIPGRVPTVVVLHGNGPTPSDLFRSLWSELAGYRVLLSVRLRSSRTTCRNGVTANRRSRTCVRSCPRSPKARYPRRPWLRWAVGR